MALKDNWIDRQNGIDDVDSEDINKVARAVIELEENANIKMYSLEALIDDGIIIKTGDE